MRTQAMYSERQRNTAPARQLQQNTSITSFLLLRVPGALKIVRYFLHGGGQRKRSDSENRETLTFRGERFWCIEFWVDIDRNVLDAVD